MGSSMITIENSGTPISSNSKQREYLNVAELAKHLGVGQNSIRNWERRGLIPVIRLGRRRIYRLDRVEAALEKLER